MKIKTRVDKRSQIISTEFRNTVEIQGIKTDDINC